MLSKIVLGIESLIMAGLFLYVLLSDWKCLTHNFTERIRLYKIRKKRGDISTMQTLAEIVCIVLTVACITLIMVWKGN